MLTRDDRFCLGDAVHRHPPNHGLGSNTCIQDAHNLAWKVAYVHRGDLYTSEKLSTPCTDTKFVGMAGKELLASYNTERQPVGLDVVTQ